MRNQLKLELNQKRISHSFGGSLLGKSYKSHAKTKRPLCTKRMIHLVMRSQYATGKYSMLQKAKQVRAIVDKQAIKFGVRIKDFVNVGNHLHITLKISEKHAFHSFLKAISGLIMRLVTGARRGLQKLNKKTTHFWDQRPFTRIIEFGRKTFQIIEKYLVKNRFEAQGFNKFESIILAARVT